MTRRLLLRDFVEHALYARAGGYFTSKHVVGGMRSVLPFREIVDEDDYRDRVKALANTGEGGTAWLTPSEQFTPYYGESVARSVLARHRRLYPGQSLQVVEVGGGNATFAADFLGLVRREAGDLYAGCQYTLVEVSESLSKVQRARLEAAGHVGGAHVEVHNQCARRWAEERLASGALEGPKHVVMLEVLDNLPHDKVRLSEREDGSTAFEQAVATQHSPSDPWMEEFEPLSDRDIQEVAQLLNFSSVDALRQLRADVAETEGALAGAGLAASFHSFLQSALGSARAEVYVPTGCWRLLRAFSQLFPTQTLTIADYNWLPMQTDGAVNAPVVQTQVGGHTVDLHGDYFRMQGAADILFPTNFGHLESLVRASEHLSAHAGSRPVVASYTSPTFLRRWHDVDATRTQSGFNPVIEDFSNTSFLISGCDGKYDTPTSNSKNA